MKAWAIFLSLAMAVFVPANSRGADPRHPDWPCVQIKVPDISVAAVWSGPSIDNVGRSWESDDKVKELVARLAARRTPLEEAEKLAADFVSGAPGGKEEKAKLLFAGLFDTLNRLRSEVLDGIERFTRRQRQFAEQIRTETLKLRALQDAPAVDQKELEEHANRLQWETRIFEDRRRTINYVCEVPVVIERRLFALARAIQQAME
jgi:hypothetical protein